MAKVLLLIDIKNEQEITKEGVKFAMEQAYSPEDIEVLDTIDSPFPTLDLVEMSDLVGEVFSEFDDATDFMSTFDGYEESFGEGEGDRHDRKAKLVEKWHNLRGTFHGL